MRVFDDDCDACCAMANSFIQRLAFITLTTCAVVYYEDLTAKCSKSSYYEMHCYSDLRARTGGGFITHNAELPRLKVTTASYHNCWRPNHVVRTLLA